jgi:mono/diheme cytochrome c family protein
MIALLLSEVANADSGKSIYIQKCIRCHNANPTIAGAIGPDVAGSSLELITLKTQKKEYPRNYKPKRKTKIMPVIKLKETQLLDLSKYLSSFSTKGR